ncbi:MAG: hypothetical protein IKV22_05270 [Paludibacteraceae bacterium]|jgi:hypothetical protein|nr:hypothetical protein [Paludibacteraceae bacterium]
MELPSELVKILVERGQILYSNIFANIDHPKFFVVVGVTEDEVAGFFYINSRINTNVNTKEEQLRLQFPISKDDYEFLSHDSYISATNVVTLPRDVIVRSMQSGQTLIKGKLLDNHMNDILNKVRSSRLFSKITKDRFFY